MSLKRYVNILTPIPEDVILLGNSVSADIGKRRLGLTDFRWALVQQDWCPCKKRRRDAVTRENRGSRAGRDVALSRGTPRLPGAGRGRTGPPLKPSEDQGPDDTLIRASGLHKLSEFQLLLAPRM